MGLPVNNAYLYPMRRQALPIIFVPGIMGSRLYNPTFETNVWDPDDGIEGFKRALQKSYLENRYEWFAVDKTELVVTENDVEHNSKFSAQYPCATSRTSSPNKSSH